MTEQKTPKEKEQHSMQKARINAQAHTRPTDQQCDTCYESIGFVDPTTKTLYIDEEIRDDFCQIIGRGVQARRIQLYGVHNTYQITVH